MGLEGMGSTQQGGSRRVAVFEVLVRHVKAGGDAPTLIEVAVGAATGLAAATSKDKFRGECKVVVNPRVLEVFEPALRMARNLKARSARDKGCSEWHSDYHALMPICRHVRDQPAPPMQALRDLARHYLLTGTLPNRRGRRRRP